MDLSLTPSLADNYVSRSQIARVLTQDWVGRELGCLHCTASNLQPTAQNTKARDFECNECSEPYELKSSSRPFRRLVADGEYRTFLSTIESGRTPNLLLLHYDRNSWTVRDLVAVHRSLLSRQLVVPRKPLGPNAKRAGWQGCSVDLELIPPSARVSLVEEANPVPWAVVRRVWSRFDFMIKLKPEPRAWLSDVMAIVRRLRRDEFHLRDVYQFEGDLRLLHPNNQHILPKVRQQLQILVAQGLLARVAPGIYRLTGRDRQPVRGPSIGG